MSNVILLIDGDNINESYTERIVATAKRYGDICEAHCFADFVKKKQSWMDAYVQHNIQLHYVPGMDKQKNKPDPNTSDIELTILATERLCKAPEIDVYVIVANDKDYVPLAKRIRGEYRKKAVMLYTQNSDKAVKAYDEAVKLNEIESDPVEQEAMNTVAETPAIVEKAEPEDYYQPKHCAELIVCIEKLLAGSHEALITKLGDSMRNDHIDSASRNPHVSGKL